MNSGNKYRVSVFTLLLLLSCGSYQEFGNAATEGYSKAKMQKFSKYMIQGKTLYATYCSNCHQQDGTGLGQLYPPLANSDYMQASIERTTCIIKNGLKGPIVVNGVTYNQAMPALEELTNLEIAAITTYIYNSWGFEKGILEVNKISQSLKECN